MEARGTKLGYAFFNPEHGVLRHHVQQLGVRYAVASAGWTDGLSRYIHEWDYISLLKIKLSMESFGLELPVIEGVGFLDGVKLGSERRGEITEHFILSLKNVSELGIRTVCYNWMPIWGWFRTDTDIKLNGGAAVTGFDNGLIPICPITELGRASQDRLQSNLKYFLKKVIPWVEKYHVQLALHPDDPSVNNVSGIERILTSVNAMQRVIDPAPSEYNGITLCQGSFAAMREDIIDSIRHLGTQNKIFFVHFRDLIGGPGHFREEFHHTGKTDVYTAMKTYYDIGFDGVIRPDHVLTTYLDMVEEQGYGTNGNLFTTGCMMGLMEAIKKGMN